MAQQVSFNLLQRNFDSASALIPSILATGQMNDFCSLSTVFVQLGNSGKNVFQMDSVQYDTVKSIAYRATVTQSTRNARTILTEVYGIVFRDTILPILDSGSGHKPFRTNPGQTQMQTNDSIATGSVKLYPNPANDKMNIAYNLSNNSISTLVIYDVMGNKVTSYTLPANETFVTENITNLSPGFYVYCVETGDNIVQRGKFIIAR